MNGREVFPAVATGTRVTLPGSEREGSETAQAPEEALPQVPEVLHHHHHLDHLRSRIFPEHFQLHVPSIAH